MALTGNEGGPIPYDQAVQWINNFRNNVPVGTITAYVFGKNCVNQVLAQQGCCGIRIYYAKDELGVPKLVIFGVDANGDGLQAYILDQGSPCPPVCGRP